MVVDERLMFGSWMMICWGSGDWRVLGGVLGERCLSIFGGWKILVGLTQLNLLNDFSKLRNYVF